MVTADIPSLSAYALTTLPRKSILPQGQAICWSSGAEALRDTRHWSVFKLILAVAVLMRM